MDILGNLSWLLKRKNTVNKRLMEIYGEKMRLIEKCIPYKIQSDEAPYFRREEVINGRIRLWELEREERDLTIKKSFLYRFFYIKKVYI